MPYTYLDHIATADVAFHAEGATREELFRAVAEAVLNVAVADIDTVNSTVERHLTLQADDLELLLYSFLQEWIYYKDTEQLLLKPKDLQIDESDDGGFRLQGSFCGEPIDPDRHELGADIKAITFHRFNIHETNKGWEATVVLDI